MTSSGSEGVRSLCLTSDTGTQNFETSCVLVTSSGPVEMCTPLPEYLRPVFVTSSRPVETRGDVYTPTRAPETPGVLFYRLL